MSGKVELQLHLPAPTLRFLETYLPVAVSREQLRQRLAGRVAAPAGPGREQGGVPSRAPAVANQPAAAGQPAPSEQPAPEALPELAAPLPLWHWEAAAGQFPVAEAIAAPALAAAPWPAPAAATLCGQEAPGVNAGAFLPPAQAPIGQLLEAERAAMSQSASGGAGLREGVWLREALSNIILADALRHGISLEER